MERLEMPYYNGRKMELLKKYETYALFQDGKTGIKECFKYSELKHKPVRTNMQEKDAIEDNINICDVCESCRYLENGDMYCDIYNKIVYSEFVFVSNKNINCNKWKKTKESR